VIERPPTPLCGCIVDRARLVAVSSQVQSSTLLVSFSCPVHHDPFFHAGEIPALTIRSFEVRIEGGNGDLLGFADVTQVRPVTSTSHEISLRFPFRLRGSEVLGVTPLSNSCYDAQFPNGPVKEVRHDLPPLHRKHPLFPYPCCSCCPHAPPPPRC